MKPSVFNSSRPLSAEGLSGVNEGDSAPVHPLLVWRGAVPLRLHASIYYPNGCQLSTELDRS